VQRQGANVLKNMTKYTSDKALKACFVAVKKCSSLGKVTPKIGLQLFDSFVLPVLEYASEIWSSGGPKKELERVQLRFIKMILGVKSSTATGAVYAETGRTPISIRHKLKTVKYWMRLTRLNNAMIVKQVYHMLRELTEVGFSTWVTNVKELLCKHNMSHFYELDYISREDEVFYLQELKFSLYEDFADKCMESLPSYPSLRSYIQFKADFKMEEYLFAVKNYKLRKCITKLRLNSHDLHIEKGRHTKPKTPLNLRTCKCCTLNTVEDEKHFLLVCPAFNVQRITFFSKIMLQCNTIRVDGDVNSIFNSIMASEDEKTLFYLGKFIQKCMDIRKSMLY
jgi:hypothetical protein